MVTFVTDAKIIKLIIISVIKKVGGKEMTKIGIITGSTREGRVNLDVANWVLDIAKNSGIEA